jgi:hypothetical protein
MDLQISNIAGPFDISNTDYHASNRVGSTKIKRYYYTTPAHAEIPQKTTHAMMLGSAIHKMALEPALFGKEYGILDDACDLRTKAGKEAKEKIESAGKIAIKASDVEDIYSIANAVQNCAFMQSISHLKKHYEQTFHATINSVDVQVRPDFYVDPCDEYPNGLIVDLKTTNDASAKAFGYQCEDLGMHISAALYQSVMQVYFQRFSFDSLVMPPFLWLAAEKKAPFATAVYNCHELVTQEGINCIARALELISESRRTGVYKAYYDGVLDVSFCFRKNNYENLLAFP